MSALRSLLEVEGLPGVRTHLQSGNVIVESGLDVGPIIREVVRREFGVDEPVMVRSRDRLAEIVAANPFPGAAADRPTLMRVIFLAEHPAPDRVKRLEEYDDVRVLDHEVYVDYRNGVGRPLSSAMVARRLALHGTERNWATLTKLLEMTA